LEDYKPSKNLSFLQQERATLAPAGEKNFPGR